VENAVITLLALLAAGLVDAGESRRTEARRNEVMNRLGLRVERTVSDLRERFAYALTLLRGADLRAYELFYDVYMAACPAIGLEPGAKKITFFDTTGRSAILWAEPRPGTGKHLGPPERWYLPPASAHHPIETMLPWLARTIGRNWADGNAALLSLRGDIDLIVDWYEATNPDLSGMTLRQALDGQRIWHESFKKNANYRGPVTRGVPVWRWDDGATIERLVTKIQVEQEGLSMGHCVGGKWSDIREGRLLVFSYRNAKGVPEATLALGWGLSDRADSLGYSEVKGPDNRRAPSTAGPRMLRFMVEALGITGDDTGDAGLYLSPPGRLALPPALLSAVDGFVEQKLPTRKEEIFSSGVLNDQILQIHEDLSGTISREDIANILFGMRDTAGLNDTVRSWTKARSDVLDVKDEDPDDLTPEQERNLEEAVALVQNGFDQKYDGDPERLWRKISGTVSALLEQLASEVGTEANHLADLTDEEEVDPEELDEEGVRWPMFDGTELEWSVGWDLFGNRETAGVKVRPAGEKRWKSVPLERGLTGGLRQLGLILSLDDVLAMADAPAWTSGIDPYARMRP
jgi:hypothetical protein